MDPMMLREFTEQVAEGRSFTGVQTGEELLVVVIGDLRQFRNDAPPRTSQRKQMDSIVFWFNLACYPPLGLKFVDDL